MTPVAATALLIALAAWLRPRPATRRIHDPGAVRRPLRRARAKGPTAEEWAAYADTVSNELRTGSSLTAAIERAGGRHRAKGQVITATATLADLTPMTGGIIPEADEAVVLQAVRAGHALGGPMTATLDSAAALLRERALIRGEALAYSAQARLSARVLTGVPLAFAGWSAITSRTFRTALASPIGMTSAVVGAACNLLGWWWMRRIVAKAVA